MADTPVNLAEWRRVLTERGVTLTDFAAAMETPLWTIYAYSQGKRRPSAEWEERAEAVARELGEAEATA